MGRAPGAGVRPPYPAPPPPRTSLLHRSTVVILALLAVGQGAYIGARLFFAPAVVAIPAVLTVQSAPSGAEVFIDGQPHGQTPLRIDLPPGRYALELRRQGTVRSMPIVLSAGMSASQYIEFGGSASAGYGSPNNGAPTGGTNPTNPASAPNAGSSTGPIGAGPIQTGAGQRGNGQADSGTGVGAAGQGGSQGGGLPTNFTGLGGNGSASAAIVGGTTSGAPANATGEPPPPPGNRGWLTVHSPLNLSVFRRGLLLGTSDQGRMQIPAGPQQVELVNQTVGYRATMAVDVPRGQQVILPVELPESSLAINSTPAARAWVDGHDVGQTPVTTVALPIGPHLVRFQHPQLGERWLTVLLRVGATAQANVDFTK
jgi:hypothetical protein